MDSQSFFLLKPLKYHEKSPSTPSKWSPKDLKACCYRLYHVSFRICTFLLTKKPKIMNYLQTKARGNKKGGLVRWGETNNFQTKETINYCQREPKLTQDSSISYDKPIQALNRSYKSFTSFIILLHGFLDLQHDFLTCMTK